MKRTTIMADEETLLELKAIAQRQGKSTSQVIREALAEYVVTHRADGRHKNPLLALVGLFDGGPGNLWLHKMQDYHINIFYSEEDGGYIVVVYREISKDDGFIITAFLTKRKGQLERRQKIWQPSR